MCVSYIIFPCKSTINLSKLDTTYSFSIVTTLLREWFYHRREEVLTTAVHYNTMYLTKVTKPRSHSSSCGRTCTVCVCINEAVTLLNRDVGGIHFCIELGNTMANNHTFFTLLMFLLVYIQLAFFAVLEYHAYYLLTRYDDGVCLRLRLLGPPIKA